MLEGFPKSRFQVETMLQGGYHVDAVLNLTLSPDICARRLLPERRCIQAQELASTKTPLEGEEARKPLDDDGLLMELTDTYT
jgi:hypothetical protein